MSTTTKQINWKVSRADLVLIGRIADRALKLFKKLDVGQHIDKWHVVMDVQAVHCNGCRLDLKRLLNNFPDADFMHDICGIYRHLDRQTGELKDCFVPRCASREEGQ